MKLSCTLLVLSLLSFDRAHANPGAPITPAYARVDLLHCLSKLQSPYSGSPPKFATLIRLTANTDGQVARINIAWRSGSDDFDKFLLNQLRQCSFSSLGKVSNEPDSQPNVGSYLMVSVPESLLSAGYRTPDPSKCRVLPEDYPLQARREEAEGDVYVEFAVGTSGRVAIAQIRSAGLHPLLEHASFTVLTRCMFRPPTGNAYRTGSVVYSWRLE